jgi:transcriptional regulator with XRE-family HTH domain
MDQAFKDRLSQKVRLLRGKLTQAKFANILKVSQSTIASWERGDNIPDLENIEKLAELAKQKPEEFLANLYGRDFTSKESLPITFAITSMDNDGLSEVLILIARKIKNQE